MRYRALLAVTPILFLLAYFSWSASQRALADIAHYPVKYWAQNTIGTPIDALTDVEKQIDSIKFAVRLDPGNPEYLQYLAWLYYLAAIKSENIIAKQDYFLLAKQAYLNAIKLRSTWAYDYANLALVKAHLNELDNEFITAYAKAESLGPWEVASNTALLQAGLLLWHKLPSHLQQKAIEATKRAAIQDWRQVSSLLNRHDLKIKICSRLSPAYKNYKRICT